MNTFDTLGISPKLLEALKAFGVSSPTPIQAQAIPEAVQGKDVIGIAQTGTGKTIAFGIPMLQLLEGKEERGLVLLPTRELALQVDETLSKLGASVGVRTAVLIGGASMRAQVGAIRRNPNIIIATPGRLIDHMQQGTIRLERVGVLVLDEADRMLDMGFQPQIKKILETIPRERTTMLFSATISRDIAQIAQKHMRTPISIEVAPQGTTAENVTQEFFIVHREQKLAMLESVLQKYSGSTLVFTRTKHNAQKLVRMLKDAGHNAAEIHGNRSLAQRRDALEGFKSGKYRVLVATDIASRGIDVKGIELVVNFDLPMDSSDYVHRIGRTARAGAEGHAISFAMPQERGGMRDIEKLIRMPIPVSPVPDDLPGPRATMHSDSRGGGQRPPFRGGGNRNFRSRGGPPRAAGGRREFVHDPSRVNAGNFQVRTGGGARRFSRTPRHKRRA
ncbi:MAG: DEAD/DEAH box helicase [Minisyncoccia bacterium]